MRCRKDLHAYQEKAVDFIKTKSRCLLTLDLGLGKTVSTLTAVSDMLDSFQANRVLVIAPLRVANSVWLQESRKWKHLHHLSIKICLGTERQRLMALQSNADIYVINRENVAWLVKYYGQRWPFDTVIIDESSSFKNASSQRFKALKKTLSNIRNIVLLTGTPSPNGLLDVWSQCYLIDYGHTLGKTMSAYKQRFFDSDYMGYSFAPKPDAPETIQNLMKWYTLSMSAEDYLELPDRMDLVERIELAPDVLKIYKAFERTLFMEFDGHEIEAVSAAVLANKLLQHANGAVYSDEFGNFVETHCAKLDALAELVEQNENETILVAYNYKSDLERLQKRFSFAEVLDKSQSVIDRWNNGQIKMLLAHPQSAGHGLNLQQGGSLIVWFGLCWSLEYYQQFNGRLHRQGQEKPVRIVHLVANGTIDERVMDVLSLKDSTQKSLLTALKDA